MTDISVDHGLQSLHRDILIDVTVTLRFKTIYRLSRTCRFFYQFCNNPQIWIKRLHLLGYKPSKQVLKGMQNIQNVLLYIKIQKYREYCFSQIFYHSIYYFNQDFKQVPSHGVVARALLESDKNDPLENILHSMIITIVDKENLFKYANNGYQFRSNALLRIKDGLQKSDSNITTIKVQNDAILKSSLSIYASKDRPNTFTAVPNAVEYNTVEYNAVSHSPVSHITAAHNTVLPKIENLYLAGPRLDKLKFYIFDQLLSNQDFDLVKDYIPYHAMYISPFAEKYNAWTGTFSGPEHVIDILKTQDTTSTSLISTFVNNLQFTLDEHSNIIVPDLLLNSKEKYTFFRIVSGRESAEKKLRKGLRQKGLSWIFSPNQTKQTCKKKKSTINDNNNKRQRRV